MKISKPLLLLAVLPAFQGCASFNSGDIRVERATARAMLEDKAIIPFSEIEVYWQYFPYRAPTDSIGEGSTRPKKIKPLPVEQADAAAFTRKAREIFAQAGLYDKARGRGTLRLELTSFGRWTYGDLFHSFLVDTGFIFIIPASLRVNYYLTADFAVSEAIASAVSKASGPQTASGTVRVETEARNKTTFHLLMAPLYPFFSPGARENGLLRQMLWRSATDVYARLKAAGVAPGQLPPKAAQKESETPAISAPPMAPDRTWLPGQPLEGAPPAAEPVPVPEQPDQTWVVPSDQPATPAAEPAAPVTPAQPPPRAPDAPDEPLDD